MVLDDLSDEVIMNIALNMNLSSLSQLALTNKRIGSIIKDDYFWWQLINRDYARPGHKVKYEPNTDKSGSDKSGSDKSGSDKSGAVTPENPNKYRGIYQIFKTRDFNPFANNIPEAFNISKYKCFRELGLDVIDSSLQLGIPVNGIFPDNQKTLLIYGSLMGDQSLVSLLLNHGVNVNFINDYGNSALNVAASNGYSVIVEKLLIGGALVDLDRNANYSAGFTALLAAAYHGHSVVVDQLIAARANVHHKNVVGRTALTVSVKAGHDIIVGQLIAAGANVNYVYGDGGTALLLAARKGNELTVKHLIAAGVDVYHVDGLGRTALSIASVRGHDVIVGELLAAGLDPDATIISQRTALMKTAIYSYPETAKRLLDAGADVNLIDNQGNTSLTLVAGSTGKILIDRGFVTSGGNSSIVDLLLKAGADINHRNYNDNTALMLAKRNGYSAIVEQLLAAGAHY